MGAVQTGWPWAPVTWGELWQAATVREVAHRHRASVRAHAGAAGGSIVLLGVCAQLAQDTEARAAQDTEARAAQDAEAQDTEARAAVARPGH